MDKCRICGWEGNAVGYKVQEMMQNTKEEFDYFSCPHCKCLQIREVPDNLEKYYGNNYYSYEEPDIFVSETVQKQEKRILDVGCGSGVWLCEMAKLGFVNLYGCDPFIQKDLEYDNGIKIYKKTIHEMEGKFDQIYLSDSFEHVTDPHEVMESLRRLLAEEGVVYLKLPVFPNIAFDMFGIYWYQLDAPRHIFLHSKESLEYLAQMHGLKIVKRTYDSNNSQIIRSFLYTKDIPFWEQTTEIVKQYFDDASINEINQNVAIANEKGYGDHAVFCLMHQESFSKISKGKYLLAFDDI